MEPQLQKIIQTGKISNNSFMMGVNELRRRRKENRVYYFGGKIIRLMLYNDSKRKFKLDQDFIIFNGRRTRSHILKLKVKVIRMSKDLCSTHEDSRKIPCK